MPLALGLTLGLTLTACGGDPEEQAAPAAPSGPPSSAPATSGAPSVGQGGVAVTRPRALTPALQRVLRERSQALRDRDREAFAAGVARSEPEFVLDQATYFDNLAQLPIERLAYRVDPSSLVRVGDDYWGVVEVSLQLTGFDAAPVVSRDRYRFSPRARGRGFTVSSVTDPAWEEAREIWSQPWDQGPVVVRSRVGVLGIFDEESVAAAPPLMGSFERGLSQVSAAVPYDWSRSAVVYALSDTAFLSTLEPPRGGDPERLDGLAFSLSAGAGSEQPASTRIALHPRLLDLSGAARDRLVRHELTHLAVGARADDVPLWLSEGLAEYVSVRPLAPEDRRVPPEVRRAARKGQITDLPDDATFNDDDYALHYAESWWAVEFLASSFGEASLWALLDDLDRLGGTTEEAEARVEDLTSFNTRTLARKAAKLIVATYSPPPSESPSPSTTPSEPGPSRTPSGA